MKSEIDVNGKDRPSLACNQQHHRRHLAGAIVGTKQPSWQELYQILSLNRKE